MTACTFCAMPNTDIRGIATRGKGEDGVCKIALFQIMHKHILYAFLDDGDYDYMNINYCPMCGRKLDENDKD